MGPQNWKIFRNQQRKVYWIKFFPFAVLGTLILWFGWFGFNGGSNGLMDEAVPLILINTFLAAAFGLLTGLVSSFLI
ncbi:MAG: hypothetical protein Ct9H300mP5_5340 [Candidatus Pelagibacterales bacterium]|nr:MAG: hypothetical protein Ct9H300mP5_5340 [Pelagibacterales bacterium]